MQYTALINADGICINAMASAGQASLQVEAGQSVVPITAQQYASNPIGMLFQDWQFVDSGQVRP